MKPKLVFFFLANESPGGIEMLWVRFAKKLQHEYDVFILDGCKISIFRKLLKDDNVSFLDFSFKGTTLPDDAVVIAPLNYPSLSGCLNGKNCGFYFGAYMTKVRFVSKLTVGCINLKINFKLISLGKQKNAS